MNFITEFNLAKVRKTIRNDTSIFQFITP